MPPSIGNVPNWTPVFAGEVLGSNDKCGAVTRN